MRIDRLLIGAIHATLAAFVRDHAFRALEAPRVVSFIYPGNTGSIRVAEKNGMTRGEDVDAWGRHLLRFELSRPD